MEKTRERVNFREWAQTCLHCGLCTIVCPVHRVEGDEYTAARGRNLLAGEASGKRDFNRAFRQRFDKCLLCGSCLPQCPQGIPIDLLTIGVREEMVKKKGSGFAKAAILRWAMRDRKRFGKILAWAYRLQKYLPAGEGKIRHLPAFLSGLGAGRRIPEIAPVFLRDQVQEVSAPAPGVNTRGRVGFFMGCAIDYIFPEIGRKIIRFLNRQGVKVIVPSGQGCCSLPVLAAGDLDTAREMALKNVEAFRDVDRVITGCATCGSALKDYGTFFRQSGEGTDPWGKFAHKVRDFSEFLIRDLGLDLQVPAPGNAAEKKMKVTYHDPCHLSRYQEITEEPRRILSSLPGVELVEMEGAELCCGMGGSFGLMYYETSKKIADQKAMAIRETNAEAVVTTCPGCRMQILDSLRRQGMPQQVLHLIELLEPDDSPQQ